MPFKSKEAKNAYNCWYEYCRRISQPKKIGRPKGKGGKGRPKGVKESRPRNLSPETRAKFSAMHSGEKSNHWLGENVGIAGVHFWVKRRKPKPLLCERCHQEPPRDLANISGKYLRDVNDFEWLCRRCHMKSDGRLEKLQEDRGRRPKTLTLEELIGEHRLRSKVSVNPDRFNVGDIIQ